MKTLPKSVWITAAAGVALFLVGDLYNSFGFLVCVCGAGLALCAWLLALGHFSKSESEKIRKITRVVKICTFTAIVLIFLSFLVIEGQIIRHSGGTEAPNARTLIVLGAGLHGEVPSATLASRLRVTLDYLNAHPEAVAIVTGGQGQGESTTEAAAMTKWLTDRGIDSARIYPEDRATDTVENLAFSKAILQQQALPGPVAVVSNGFHLYRAQRLAEQAGLGEVQTIGAPVPQAWLIPSVYLREYCSVLLMFARDFL